MSCCGSPHHSQEGCAKYGGGHYAPSQDPVLTLAERKAVKAKHTKAYARPRGNVQRKRPIQPPPPPWIRGSGSRFALKEPDTPPPRFNKEGEDVSDGEYAEVEGAEDSPPSLVESCKRKPSLGIRLRLVEGLVT